VARIGRRSLVGAAAGALLPAPTRAEQGAEWFDPAVRQLFLDDAGLETMRGVRRTVHPPRRHPRNPVLRPDTPWERGCQVYGTALYDEAARRFRLWYLTGPRERGERPLIVGGRERPPHTTLVAYAESPDGVEWAKPRLGLFPYDGDRATNLVPVGQDNTEGIAVLHEPREADAGRRWKALFWEHGSGGWEMRNGRPFAKDGPTDGIWTAWSADGLRWTHNPGNPVIGRYSDTSHVLLHDPRLGRYVAFGRFGFGRRLARTESEDFLRWSDPRLVLECDAGDGPGTQIYGAGIDLYEGLYLGMIWIYREGGDATIDTQLAVSRDGVRWTRVGERAAWLRLGDEDSWEGGMVRSVGRIIRRGDLLYVYYCGVHGPHGRPGRPPVIRKHPVQIGLVTVPRDRFVSLGAGAEPGTVVTRVFPLPPGRLHLNVAAARGEVRAALEEPGGMPLARSAPVGGDRLDASPRFAERLPAPGVPVRLRLTLRDAEVFSYWFSRESR
jgi:hypothetical protein